MHTAPGTVITITATAQVPGGELVTASTQVIIVNPALWRDVPLWRPFYSARSDPLLNGGPVRRIMDGQLVDGIQVSDGSLFPR